MLLRRMQLVETTTLEANLIDLANESHLRSLDCELIAVRAHLRELEVECACYREVMLKATHAENHAESAAEELAYER